MCNDLRRWIFLNIKSTEIRSSSTTGDGSCGFRALRQASERAAIPVHLRDNMPIRDMDYDDKLEREAQIGWAENILNTSAPYADLSTLHTYVEWLKIPDVPCPGVTDRSSYERLHWGVNGWMATNDSHALAATLPYIGLFTIVGSAILNKATYLFFTNSKTIHHGNYPGSVLLDLVNSGNYTGFPQVHF